MRERLDGAIGERAVARVQVERRLRRLLEVEPDRPWIPHRRPLVPRELGRYAQVQPLALALRKAVVRDVPHEPVAEPPHPGALLIMDEELLVLQERERTLVRLGDRGQLGDVERGAREDRGLADQLASRRRQVVDARRDDGLDGGRQARARAQPGAGRLDAGLHQHPGRLHDEERVAAGVLRDAPRGVGLQPLASLQGKLGRFLQRQRLQVQVERVAEAAAHSRPLVQELVPSHAQHEHRHALGRADERLDRVQQERVGQVDVLEDQHDRSPPGEPGDERQEARAELAHAVPALVAAPRAQPERDHSRAAHRLRLLGRAALLHQRVEALAQPLVRRAGLLADRAEDHLCEGRERDVLAERARAADEHGGRLGQSVEELLGDAALADAGLAEQRHEVAARGLAHALEGVGQQAELASPVHERDRPPRRPRREPQGESHAVATSSNPFASMERLPVLDVLVREEPARLGDEHAARLGRLLHARRQVHGGTEQQPLLGRLGADRDRPGVDHHADAERRRQLERLTNAPDAVHEREPARTARSASSS